MVEGQWVFGGRETNDRSKMFMVPVADRTAATLISIIERWIERGSTIVSDCWKPYDRLGQIGYTHLTVNHSVTFKNSETGAHTNIECEWLHAKRCMPSYGVRHHHMTSYLGEHLWKVAARNEGGDIFLKFLRDVSTIYNPATWELPR